MRPMPSLRPFRPSDAEVLVNRDGARGLAQTVITQAQSGLAYTADVQGHPIGCGGVLRPWPGIVMCWMLLGEDVCRYPVWVMRVVRHLLRDVERTSGPVRFEAMALVESPRNQRWLEALGFTVEQHGIARAYLPGQIPIVRYERITG